jgi:hypothetical protein
VLVAALSWRKVHEVPGKERIGQREIGVDPCDCQCSIE